MNDKRFDPKKLQKLNNPKRLLDIPVDAVWKMLSLPGSDTLIEIGAGTAFFSIAFLEQAGAKKLYACDVSGVMLDWMTANVVPDHPEIVPVKTEAETVPLESGIADLVFMVNLHHELDDPAKLLAESYRLIKPGGNVLVIDWKKKEMAEGPPSDIRCELSEVEEQLAVAGFTNISGSLELEKHFIVIGRKN